MTVADADVAFMREALAEALRAEALGEVPVGAVVVADGADRRPRVQPADFEQRSRRRMRRSWPCATRRGFSVTTG